MFLQAVKTPGLAHLSYIAGDGGKACVVDPRRDCELYIDIARQNNCTITAILETHRNEDLVSGAPALAKLTGATVYHGPHADGTVKYADLIVEGEMLEFGNLAIEVLETPGHTKDSVSYLLFDRNFGQSAVGIFTGDTLFIGDVGRTDFYPDQAREVAGMMFDSLRKIVEKAPDAIVYPAHGSGSVCGDNMADRDFSTVAHEMANNPMLNINDRETFIDRKVAEDHVLPPYFSHMEQLNLTGGARPQQPLAVTRYQWPEIKDQEVKIVDVRREEAYLGAHYPGSYALPTALLSAYAGWLFKPQDEIVLVAQDHRSAEEAAVHFSRIGMDGVAGYIEADLMVSAVGRNGFAQCPVVGVDEVRQRTEKDEEGWTLLDVRKSSERRQRYIEDSIHIFLGDLLEQATSLDKNRAYTTMCASGKRATVAASILRVLGFKHVDVFMGSMGAWQAADLPVQTPE